MAETKPTGVIRKLQKMMTDGSISCRELTQRYLSAIEKENPGLNAYIRVTPDIAMETAARVDEKLAKGIPLAPLEGIPMTLKDNISTDGMMLSFSQLLMLCF